MDFARLILIAIAGAYFVARAKINLQLFAILESNPRCYTVPSFTLPETLCDLSASAFRFCHLKHPHESE